MSADIRGMVSDADVGVEIELGYTGGTVFDAATGISAGTTSTDTLTCYRAPLTERQIAQSAGMYQTEDMMFLVSSESLTSTPDQKTTIRETGTGDRWAVITVQRDVLGAHYDIRCRKAGG